MRLGRNERSDMRRVIIAALACTFLGGCLEKAPPDGSTPQASSARSSDDDPKKRDMCEHTMEGNEPKTFCY